MRNLARIVALVAALAAGAWALAQTPVKTITVNGVLEWERPKVNEDGSAVGPDDIVGYLFELYPDGVDPATAPPLQSMKVEGPALSPCPGDQCEHPLARLVEDVAVGRYRIYARAYDLVGNMSKRSAPTPPFHFDALAPPDKLPPGSPPAVDVREPYEDIIEIRIRRRS